MLGKKNYRKTCVQKRLEVQNIHAPRYPCANSCRHQRIPNPNPQGQKMVGLQVALNGMIFQN